MHRNTTPLNIFNYPLLTTYTDLRMSLQTAAVFVLVTWLPICKIVQVHVTEKIHNIYSLVIVPYKFKTYTSFWLKRKFTVIIIGSYTSNVNGKFYEHSGIQTPSGWSSKTNAVLHTANATRYKLTYFMADGRALSRNIIDMLRRSIYSYIDSHVLYMYVRFKMGVRKEEHKFTYPSDFMDVVGLF